MSQFQPWQIYPHPWQINARQFQPNPDQPNPNRQNPIQQNPIRQNPIRQNPDQVNPEQQTRSREFQPLPFQPNPEQQTRSRVFQPLPFQSNPEQQTRSRVFQPLPFQPNPEQQTRSRVFQPNPEQPARYTVIPNSGQDEGMYNQCMWISIRDFLMHNGYSRVTTRRIRAVAGLDSSTEFVSFDFMKPEFASALFRIANYYNLQIVIFSVNRDGTRSHSVGKFIMDPIQGEIQEIDSYIPTEGVFTVNIAQYGSSHFELIVNGPGITPIPNTFGMPFVPAVPVKTAIASVPATTTTTGTTTGSNTNAKSMVPVLRKVSELTPSETEIANLQIETNTFVLHRRIIEDQLRNTQSKMEGDDKQMHNTLQQSDLPQDLKKHLVDSLTEVAHSNLKIINEYNQQLQRIDTQILELQTRIFVLER